MCLTRRSSLLVVPWCHELDGFSDGDIPDNRCVCPGRRSIYLRTDAYAAMFERLVWVGRSLLNRSEKASWLGAPCPSFMKRRGNGSATCA